MPACVDPPILPTFLYRYRPLRNDREFRREMKAIKDRLLWCSDYRHLNDPMEGFYQPSSRVENHAAYRNIASSIVHSKHSIGICCFSDTFDSELMWTHYASHYTGICVGYRTRDLIEGLPDNVHLVRVAYDSDPPFINKNDALDAHAAAIKILSHKKANWIYEREWRLLASLGGVPIASDACVKHIRLGSRINADHRQRILKTFKKFPVKISEMAVSDYEHDWNELQVGK